LFANQFTEEHIAPSPVLINAVAALAFGALGLASVDKIWGKKETRKNNGKLMKLETMETYLL
jgi:hypothetical protein